jgi:hypothetical protein
MAAEGSGPAQFDGAQHALLPHGQRFGMRLAKLVAMRAYDVCDFECRPHQTATYGCGSITGKGSRSKGLVVAQTVLVARQR